MPGIVHNAFKEKEEHVNSRRPVHAQKTLINPGIENNVMQPIFLCTDSRMSLY